MSLVSYNYMSIVSDSDMSIVSIVSNVYIANVVYHVSTQMLHGMSTQKLDRVLVLSAVRRVRSVVSNHIPQILTLHTQTQTLLGNVQHLEPTQKMLHV